MELRHASGSAIVLYSTAAIKQIKLIIILFSPNLGSNVKKEKKKDKKKNNSLYSKDLLSFNSAVIKYT